MATIQTAIQLTDRFTRPMRNIAGALTTVINEFETVQSVSGQAFDMSQLGSAKAKLAVVDSELQKIESDVEALPSAQKRAENGFKGWQKAIIVANQGVNLIKNTIGRLGLTDLSGAFGRLDTMNRFNKTVSVMTGNHDMAQAALEQLKDTTLGTAYGLDVASKSAQNFLTRGMSLGNATDQVRIWSDAVSFYGEGTNEQLESVVDAIGKMYSKGTVEADQLDRLFDAGIDAAGIYAQAVGQNVGVVKDHLRDGKISAEQFINTVSQNLDSGVSAGAAKDAGATWATTFANMRAAVTRGWSNIITQLDEALASRGLPSSMELVTQFGDKVEQILIGVGNAMGYVVDGAIWIYNVMSSVAGFIVDNWSLIVPVIGAIIFALGLYTGALVIHNAAQKISNAQKKIAEIRAYRSATAILADKAAHDAEAIATAEATVAQAGFNTALYACPLTWIIIAIIAIIALIYIIVAAINKLTGSTISATGIIIGAFAVVGAFIWNQIYGLFSFIVGIGVELYNLIASFANFFGNVFNDPVGAIVHLFVDLFDFILGIVESVASVIDAVFGSGLSDAVAGFRDDAQNWADDMVGKQEEIMPKVTQQEVMNDLGLHRIGYGDAWDAGYSAGEDLANSGSGLFDGLFGDDLKDDPYDKAKKGAQLQTDYNSSTNKAVKDTAKNTADISDKLDTTSEQLKYIREFAERESVNRFTTANINVSMTNNNNINSDTDLDGIMDTLKNGIQNQMNIVAEGAL